MDPLVVNLSLGLVVTSSTAALWFLHKEHNGQMRRYRTMEERMGEVERVFSELKAAERNVRKKQAKQADLGVLEEKIRKAEKELLAIKSGMKKIAA
ncbi:MAG: hypothetical protein V1717_03130 [Candidatus Micrarchaeota archaeon]